MEARRGLTKALVCSLALVLGSSALAQHEHDAQANVEPAEAVLRSHTMLLDELSERSRLNTFFRNEQSPFHGVPIRYVNSFKGNVTFVRRDLVAIGRIPIVLARVYDSTLGESRDFGRGWRVSLAETISSTSRDTLVYLDDSGSVWTYVAKGGGAYGLKHPVPTDVASVVASGNVIRVSTRNGWNKLFTQAGDAFYLTQIEDPYGNKLTMRLESGLLKRIEGDNGRYIAIERTASGRVARITDDQGRSVSYEYDQADRLADVLDVGGNRWRYTYDRGGRLARVSDPEDREAFIASYAANGKAKDVAVLGVPYRYAYKNGSTQIRDGARRLTRIAHDPSGLALSIRNSAGFASEVQLDAQRRIKALLHDGKLRAAFSYDAAGQMSSMTRHDEEGALVFGYERDSAGRVTSIRSPNGVHSSFAYNAAGDLQRRASGGPILEYEYNERGDLRLVTQGDAATTYSHNADGQIESINAPAGESKLSYYSDGKLRSIQFPDGSIHEYRYNALGFRDRVERSDGTSKVYEYDVAGNLARSDGVNADGRVGGQTIELDEHSRPASVSFPGGGRISVAYDSDGNPQAITQETRNSAAEVRDRSELEYFYDASNRVVAVRDGEIISGSYTYEGAERDLRAQMGHGTQRVGADAFRQSASIGDLLSIAYARTSGSMYGPVRYDEETRAFDLAGEFGLVNPDAVSQNSLSRQRYATREATTQRRVEFDQPSNITFVPREYETINCENPWCDYRGVVLKANHVTGSITVTAGTPIEFRAMRASGGTCQRVYYTWQVNGAYVNWSQLGIQIHTFTAPGTYLVEAIGECIGCDEFRLGSIWVTVVSPPPPSQVNIEYTMFIPLDHVRLPSFLSVAPYTFFGGDNKASHIPGDSRFRIQQLIRWTSSNGSLQSSAASGVTGEYYEATRLTTEGSCYRKTCSCPTYPPLGESIINQGMCKTGAPHATGLAGGMHTITAQITSQTATSMTLRFSGEPFNVLEPASQWFGDIDWRHILTVDWSTYPVRFTLQYQHDGFPYHDLRINGQTVRLFDPVPYGQTPLSLNGTGSGEWSGTVSGNL